VLVKRETASAIAPAANRVLFIRAENGQTLLTQSEREKSKAYGKKRHDPAGNILSVLEATM
jgi:hypothetical protein